MNILDWFAARFVTCSEKDRAAARRLLVAGRRQALSGWKPLCARHPALRALADGPCHEAYEYGYTVAFAVMAMLGATMYFPPAKRRGTTEAIKAELENWRRDAYGNDGHHLMSKLNLAAASAEATVGAWLVGQVARKADDQAAADRLRELGQNDALTTALGTDIITHAAEEVVACFLEDKNS